MIVLLKRSVSLFLVLLLIIGAFTACATKDKDDDANLVTATVKYKDIAKTVILIGKSAIMPIHLTVFQRWS